MAGPSISVVIPCFDGEAFIEETLHSALGQTLAPIEVLVVDDGSRDRSAERAEAFGPPVRVVRQANRGESRARNRGFELARGEWIAFLDADDRWEPTKLEHSAAAIAPDVVCVHTAYYKFGDVSGVVDRSPVPPHRRYDPRHLALRNFIPPSSAMVRRSVKARFREDHRYGEDLLFMLDLLQEGRFAMVAEPLTGHRVHGRAQSASARAELGWHASVGRWLEGASHLTPAERRAIARGWDRRLALVAWQLQWSGDAEGAEQARQRLGVGRRAAALRAALHLALSPGKFLRLRREAASRRSAARGGSGG